MRHLLRCSVVAPVLVLLAFPQPVVSNDRAGLGKHAQIDALFSATEYLGHITYLASDELEGRGTGQPGIDLAADYIADVFRQHGLEPAGGDGTYFQEFPIRTKNQLGDATRFAVGTMNRRTRRPTRLHEDYIPFPFSKTGSFKGEVVFAGYGIDNHELGHNDYEDLDVTDKVVLMLRMAPEYDDFGFRDKTFRAKASRANAREAAAVLIVNRIEEDREDKLYAFGGGPGGYFGFGRRTYGIPMLHVSQRLADAMLRAAEMPDLATLQQRIEDMQMPASFPLEGVSVSGLVDIEPVETPARNVVGTIPGTGPDADEYIVLGAHYDHLGVQNKSEDDFDPEKDIFNGADDNASGTAMLMTMAKAYTEGPGPNRSLMLIAFTAEEKGLVGSRHFVNNPTIDLDQCVAMINFDMVGRLENDELRVIGMQTGGFEEMVTQNAEPHGLSVDGGGLMGGGSDHMMFQQKGIPALFFFTGIHEQYHKPADDTHLIDADGAMRIAKLAADCIDEIDEMEEPPEYQDGSRGDGSSWWFGRGGDREADERPARRGRRVQLGVSIDTDDDPGVRVLLVVEDTPAARAGIENGDRILAIGDSEINSITDLASALSEHEDGDQTTLVVIRDAKRLTLDVRFGAHDHTEAEANEPPRRVRFGIRPRSDDLPGLLVGRVSDDSPAARAGVEAGDRIIRLGDASIEDAEDILGVLAAFEDGDSTSVVVARNGEHIELEVLFGDGDEASEPTREGEEDGALADLLAEWIRSLGPSARGSITARSSQGSTIEVTVEEGAWPKAFEKANEGRPAGAAAELLGFVTDALKTGAGPVTASAHVETTWGGTAVELEMSLQLKKPIR